MFEATKTRAVRGEAFERTYFSGSVLDIGCGPDPVVPHAQPFDLEQGDANEISKFLAAESFDCVHSSHCLEHMMDPPRALTQWWSLVRPGGFLVIVVPDEDLYEQGIWPSVFNPDHKATFRLGGSSSWSPVSYDIRALAATLPNGTIVDCSIQDHGYDRRLVRKIPSSLEKFLLRIGRRREVAFSALMRRGLPLYRVSSFLASFEHTLGKPFDQTQRGALAQIQTIVRKRSA
jgi:SAM-dependent methyltransferase